MGLLVDRLIIGAAQVVALRQALPRNYAWLVVMSVAWLLLSPLVANGGAGLIIGGNMASSSGIFNRQLYHRGMDKMDVTPGSNNQTL